MVELEKCGNCDVLGTQLWKLLRALLRTDGNYYEHCYVQMAIITSTARHRWQLLRVLLRTDGNYYEHCYAQMAIITSTATHRWQLLRVLLGADGNLSSAA